MPRPENVPTATLELDRPRKIAFTLGAIRRAKELTGKSILVEGLEVDQIGAILWAMLVEEDRKDVTPEQLEDMIHVGSLTAIAGTVEQLRDASVPSGAEGNGIPAPKRARRPRK